MEDGTNDDGTPPAAGPGPDAARPKRPQKVYTLVVEVGRKAGDGRVALQLAMVALHDPADPAFARICLTEAQASSHLAIRTTAAALMAGLDATPTTAPVTQ